MLLVTCTCSRSCISKVSCTLLDAMLTRLPLHLISCVRSSEKATEWLCWNLLSHRTAKATILAYSTLLPIHRRDINSTVKTAPVCLSAKGDTAALALKMLPLPTVVLGEVTVDVLKKCSCRFSISRLDVRIYVLQARFQTQMYDCACISPSADRTSKLYTCNNASASMEIINMLFD